jgi:hypothetical protein
VKRGGILFLSAIAFTQIAAHGQYQMTATQDQPGTTSRTAKEMLATARSIYILSHTHYAPSEAIIAALQGSESFEALGIAIIEVPKDEHLLFDADLLFDIDRAPFTTEYSFTVIDRQSSIVVASGHVNSLFGTVPGKVTDSLVKQIKAARNNQPKK